ncbi:MAG: IPT/TIG domain-containing protein [Chloroflexota bacterium]|nr:IPT/TIG domain-containing protein [Chloroflexota bacterium]
MEMSRHVAIRETTNLLRLLLVGAMISVSISLIAPIQSVMANTVSVESLDTTSGSRGSTIEDIVITGSGFTGATSVSFGEGITVTDFSVDSDTQITADISIDSAADLGARDITVTTPTAETLDQSQTGTGSGHAIYNDGTSDYLRGQTFLIGKTGTLTKIALTLRRYGSPPAIQVEIRDRTVDYTPGTTIYASTTKDANQISSLEYAEYEFDFASPISVTAGEKYAIVVKSAEVLDNSNYYNVRFLYDTVTDPYEDGRYSYSTDGGSTWNTGYTTRADLYFKTYITTSGSTGTLLDGFTVKIATPVVSAISPTFGAQGGTMDVLITGTGFTNVSTVDFGTGVTVNSFTEDSSTQITTNVTVDPYATIDTRNVSVTNEGGTSILSNQFTVITPPTVTAVSPTSANPGDTIDVVIIGTNFTGASNVTFGTGVTVNSWEVDSATQITANITLEDSAEIGARDISVTTGGVAGTLVGGLPIESFNPPSTSGNDINWTWFYLSAAALAVCAVAVSGAHVLRTRMVKRPGDDTWQTVAEASIEMDQLNKLPLISRLVLPESTSAPETPTRAPEAVATNHDEKDLSHLIEELLLDSNGNPCPLRIGDMSDKDMDNAIRALERIDDHLQEQTWGKAAKAIREMVKAD